MDGLKDEEHRKMRANVLWVSERKGPFGPVASAESFIPRDTRTLSSLAFLMSASPALSHRILCFNDVLMRL